MSKPIGTMPLDELRLELAERVAVKCAVCGEGPGFVSCHLCGGTGKVYPLRKLCPCPESVLDTCCFPLSHSVACIRCQGRGWVPGDCTIEKVLVALHPMIDLAAERRILEKMWDAVYTEEAVAVRAAFLCAAVAVLRAREERL